MNIVGILVIIAMPYMAGYILKSIMNRREIRQIETYLTGFFFVFLIQGVVAFFTYFIGNCSFATLCNAYNATFIAIAVIFVMLLIVNLVIMIVKGRGERAYRPKLHKLEYLFLTITILLACCIIYRVFDLQDYLREDIMLPTIRTTLATNTIYEYNPITSQQFTLGLISSKRIISLPVFYAYICRVLAIDEPLLIYVVMTIQTLVCTFFACMLFIVPVLKNRSKNIFFSMFLAAVILSGDYFSGSIGYKLLWNGYAGDTIVAATMLPYLMYVLTDWYRVLRGDDANKSVLATGITNSIKILICFVASLFITGITSGILLLAIELTLLGVACIVRYRAEEGRV